MRTIIILSGIILTGCAAFDKDPCVNPLGADRKAEPNEVVYGWTKAELAAMPKWCGRSNKHTIYDRSGRVIGYIR